MHQALSKDFDTPHHLSANYRKFMIEPSDPLQNIMYKLKPSTQHSNFHQPVGFALCILLCKAVCRTSIWQRLQKGKKKAKTWLGQQSLYLLPWRYSLKNQSHRHLDQHGIVQKQLLEQQLRPHLNPQWLIRMQPGKIIQLLSFPCQLFSGFKVTHIVQDS